MRKKKNEQMLGAAGATAYRAVAARANYLVLDRVDLQYSVKEICRGMSDPKVGDQKKLRRLGRYLRSHPRQVMRYDWQDRIEGLTGYSDSDWAGCRRTSRSTSGGVMMIGDHFIRSWSSTQKSVTLSSGEAELVALVKLSTEMLGIMQMSQDWGLELSGDIYMLIRRRR